MSEPATPPSISLLNSERATIVLLDNNPIEVDLSEWRHLIEAREASRPHEDKGPSIVIMDGCIPELGEQLLIYSGSFGEFAGMLVSPDDGKAVVSAVFSVCSTFGIPHRIGVTALSAVLNLRQDAIGLTAKRLTATQRIAKQTMTSEEFQQITDESVAFEEQHGGLDLVGPASAFRSLGPPKLRIKEQGVFIDGTNLVVSIEDGRVISVPLSWFPKLDNATPEQRFGWRLIAGGSGICWDELDEDLSLRGLLSERAQPLPRP